MTETDLNLLNSHSMRNRVEIQKSDVCGCFHCMGVFTSSDVKAWIDTGQTATCPRCGMDSVVGSASGFPIAEEVLEAMNARWFRASKTA